MLQRILGSVTRPFSLVSLENSISSSLVSLEMTNPDLGGDISVLKLAEFR